MSSLDYQAPSEPISYDYNAGTRNTRAIITTKWGRGGYLPRVVQRIQNYYVDTSLDNDADPWTLEIGDPTGIYLDTLQRDSEVRVEIFGVGSTAVSLPLLTGIADEVDYGDDGILRFLGRDFSSVAIDSTVEPGQYRKFQAWRLVDQQAREIGFKRTMLAKSGPNGPIIKKLQVTDGSESYWEFWHRMYRKEQMWIWTQPDATLVAGQLNYESPASYYFGTARAKDPKNIARQYIPVERLEIKKSTQARLGEVWVFGHKGDNGFLVKQADPTTRGWIKRPRKIMLDTESHTRKAALKTAWEEIFETKVGALEYTLTIPDPGFTVQQNRIAILNLVDPDIHGEFFVVGIRSQVSDQGFVQEIRLRERQYAISRRVPQDLKLKSSSEPSQGTQDSGFAAGIASVGNMPDSWGTFFVKAANKFHGPWDYNLFLAVLLAICEQETNFFNERANGGPGGDHHEWEPPPKIGQAHGSHGESVSSVTQLNQWKERFANEPGDGFVSSTFAVGPMQLYSLGYKQYADDLMRANYRDEFQGGRWHPEHNIMAGAYALRDKLKTAVGDSGRDIDMWAGVSYYGHHYAGESPTLVPTRYAVSVKNKVYNDPGYLQQVKDQRKQAADASKQPQDSGAFDTGNAPQGGFHNSEAQLAKLTHLRLADSSVDCAHVNYILLKRINALAASDGRNITITSGFRYTGTPIDGPGAAPNGHDTQWYLWKRYVNSGYSDAYIAAKPGTSNHEKGEACDCIIGGIPVGTAFSSAKLATFGIHASVLEKRNTDAVHITRIGIEG